MATYTQSYLDQYDGGQVLGCAVAFIVIETLMVALRCFSRYVTKTKVGIDDFLLIPVLFFGLSVPVVGICLWKYTGLGRHAIAIALEDPGAIALYIRMTIGFEVAYGTSTIVSRIAILFLYLRIFKQKSYRLACFTVMGVHIFYLILATVLSCTVCVPLEKLWNPFVPGNCFNVLAWNQWSGLPGVLMQVIMLILPVPVILRLRLSKKDKIGLLLTFSTGLIKSGFAASLVRLATFFQVTTLEDLTWIGPKGVVLAITETGCDLIAVCLPCLRTLYLYYGKKGQFSSLEGSVAVMRTKRTGLGSIGDDIPFVSLQDSSIRHFDAGIPKANGPKYEDEDI